MHHPSGVAPEGATGRVPINCEVTGAEVRQFAAAPTRHITVERARISYRLWDDVADPAAASILFLHGFRAHSHWWDHIIPAFTQDYRVATMDFGGLGQSDWRDSYTSLTFAHEVLAVIKAAALGPTIVVGHSFGGTPALRAGLIAPEAFAQIIIVDSHLIMKNIPEPSAARVGQASLSKRVYSTQAEMLAQYRLVPNSGPVPDDILRHIAKRSGGRNREGWSWKFDARLDPLLRSDAERFFQAPTEIPVDLIYGENSSVVSPQLARQIISQLGNRAAPIVIPGSDHHILLEQPVALIDAIRGLITSRMESTPPGAVASPFTGNPSSPR